MYNNWNYSYYYTYFSRTLQNVERFQNFEAFKTNQKLFCY